ncbi:hypothetical protein E2C01_102327 [Portunus trituberculatus]|uniref:Uncharacterized protein n=1 Tax=Portunus trituberculatus TaxID=210409 RepID=A0A5B7KCW0_PORTR|nr:hypothetical protein [Portunus trituberculatus]
MNDKYMILSLHHFRIALHHHHHHHSSVPHLRGHQCVNKVKKNPKNRKFLKRSSRENLHKKTASWIDQVMFLPNIREK